VQECGVGAIEEALHGRPDVGALTSRNENSPHQIRADDELLAQ